MTRRAALASLLLLLLGCRGTGSEPDREQPGDRVAPPATDPASDEDQDPDPAADAPARDPLTYLPPDVRLVGQLDLAALLDSPDRRQGFVRGFSSGSPRLEAHTKAIERCLGGVAKLESITFGTPAAIAPVLVVRGRDIGTPDAVRCYVESPGIDWSLDEDATRFSLGGEQAFGFVAGPHTVVLSLDHPEGPLLQRIVDEGESLLDGSAAERPALDEQTRQGHLWVSVRIDDAMRPQLADTPASSLRSARCRVDVEGEVARAACRFELDPAQASSLAASLADPDRPLTKLLETGGLSTDSLRATVKGESLTVTLDLPFSALFRGP